MSFFDVHSILGGLLFMLGLMLFPRITLIFFSSVTGGILFWIVTMIMPRIIIAILAAVYYWRTNPILVIMTFLWCLGGEGAEKEVARRSV